VLLSFPLEFLVHGTPVSLQAKRPAAKTEWRERVKDASRTVLPEEHFASDERMAVTMYYLPDEPIQGDIVNIVSPILAALNKAA
jgi:crossover junction endodeoxyribonuclease RusA